MTLSTTTPARLEKDIERYWKTYISKQPIKSFYVV